MSKRHESGNLKIKGNAGDVRYRKYNLLYGWDIQPLQLQKIMKTMQKLMKTLQKINETLQFGTSFILCTFSTIIHVLNFHRTPV